jgi:hypothetical protein
MKIPTTFLPWLIYGIVSSIFPDYAMVVGLISSLFSYSNLKKGCILEWASLLFFFIGTLNDLVIGSSWLSEHFALILSLFLLALAGISLTIGQPFTLQYAKLETDPMFWDHPLFLRINQIMTGGFGIIFLGLFLVSLYQYFHPGILNGWLIWPVAMLLKIVFIKRFPKWYKARYLLKVSE